MIKDTIRSSKNKAVLYGIAASASWGISTVMSKSALEHVDPVLLLVLQLIASNLFLWVILYNKRIKFLSFWDSIKVGLPGFLQPGIAYTLGLIGLSLTNASIDALIWSTESLVIILFARLLLGEKLRKPFYILSVLGFIGVVLVSINFNNGNVFVSSSLVGNALILAATSCAALYTIISRKLVFTVDSLLLVSLNQLTGLLASMVFLLLGHFSSVTLIDTSQITWNTCLLIIVSGITLHGLPFWLHTMLLEDLEASISAFFITLIPVFAIIGSFLFLGERLSLIQWIGGVLIISSVLVVAFFHKE